jgi:hypothetical protein|tara:strand:- start:175 stop:585 length:411 start_codon:yes stop_codon:yes gene_type:complete
MQQVTDPTSTAFTYWDNYPQDNPFHLNGFKGTFAFSDHLLIPEPLTEFLLEFYRGRTGERRKNHIIAIPLEEINELLNEQWEGPGSMSKIVRMTYELKANRLLESPVDSKSALKGYEAPTYESNLNPNAVDRIEKS